MALLVRRQGRARGLAEQALERSGMTGASKAAEAEVDEAPWESGPGGCSDGRLEAARCQGPRGGVGGDASAPQASPS